MGLKTLQVHQKRRTDSCWSWVVCISSFIVHFLVIGQLNSFGSFFVALLEEFGRSEAETAWIGSLSVGMTFILGPVSAGLCERYGCRAVMCAGSVLFLAGMMLTSLVKEMAFMYLTYGVLVGISFSFFYFSAFTAVSLYFSKNLSLANGIAFSGGGCGTLALSLLTNTLISQYGLRTAIRLLACMSLPILLAGLTYSPVDIGKTVDVKKDCEEKVESKKKTAIAHQLVKFLRPSQVFKNKAFVVWTVALGLILFCYFVPYMYLARIAEDVGVPPTKGAMLVGYCAMAQTAGKFLFGRLADLRSVNRLVLTQTSLLVMAVATALLPLAKDYSALVTYSVVSGFFDGGFVIMIGLVTHDIVGRKMMNKAFGTMYGVVAVPMTIGPPVAGRFYDSFGNYHIIFFLCSGFITAGICLMFLIPWLIPLQDDTEKFLLLPDIPTTVKLNDEAKDPESPSLRVDSTIFYDELVGNVDLAKTRLLRSEPSRESRPNSFILFSIVPRDSYRDLSVGLERRENSRSTTTLTLHRPSPLTHNEGVGCDARMASSVNELCQSNDTGTPSRLVQNVKQSMPDICVMLPELTTDETPDMATKIQAAALEVEAVEAFASSYTDNSYSGPPIDISHGEMGVAEQDPEHERLRCASCNSSDSDISWKSASQASDGTNDSGYVEGIMPSYPSGDFEQNLDPKARPEDKASMFTTEACKCGLKEERMDSTMTRHGSTQELKITNSTFDCYENMLADAIDPGPNKDYYSDVMESKLEESTCACAEEGEHAVHSSDALVSASRDSNSLSKVGMTEAPDIFSQAVEKLLEEAHELEQDLLNRQVQLLRRNRTSSPCGASLCPSHLELYLSLSSETIV